MVWPLIAAAAITAAGSIASGYLSSKGQGKESKIQKQKRYLVDDLLASLRGGGKYGDLFNADPAAFQKAFVEPAKAMFRNQISPQIQQQYIASGQQRGTGLDDQLLRAGVDLDQMLNQEYMKFYEGAQNRKANAINSIFGAPGGEAKPSSNDRWSQAAGGYLGSDAFADVVKQGASAFGGNAAANNQPQAKARPGYASDWRQAEDWKLGDSRWGMYG